MALRWGEGGEQPRKLGEGERRGGGEQEGGEQVGELMDLLRE